MVELDTPTVKEELCRKTSEAVDWLLRSFQREEISKHAFETAINAVFMCTGGLVDEELTRAMSVRMLGVGNIERTVLVNFTTLRTLSLTINKSAFTLSASKRDSNGESIAFKTYTLPDLAMTYERLRYLKETAQLNGYMEI